jgi:uncharacterized membrane protein
MGVVMATFLQLLVSAVLLAAISLLTEDITVLADVPLRTWINFALAGFSHFFIGWTFLNASQKKIGAARTGALIGATPIFAAVIAALTLDEALTVITFLGILLIVLGVFLVNTAREPTSAPVGIVPFQAQGTLEWRKLSWGLAAALMWSISPIFIRYGLQDLPSPILGVTIGVAASALGYAVLLLVRANTNQIAPFTRDALSFKILAGVLVGLSTWVRWTALELAPVAIVLALTLVSVPVVNLLAPLLVERHLEQVTMQVWLGSSIIVIGSLVLIFLG